MFVDALLAEHRGEELAAVADMYDKAAGALTKELGAESKPTEVARARAAAARAGRAARGEILILLAKHANLLAPLRTSQSDAPRKNQGGGVVRKGYIAQGRATGRGWI